jgi:hypothetical protein
MCYIYAVENAYSKTTKAPKWASNTDFRNVRQSDSREFNTLG